MCIYRRRSQSEGGVEADGSVPPAARRKERARRRGRHTGLGDGQDRPQKALEEEGGANNDACRVW